jgi:TatD DNase family protein
MSILKNPSLIDIGVNLGHASFNADRQQVIDRAVAAGVYKLVVTGTSIRSSLEAQTLASRFPDILCSTAGVHPHNAKNCNNETIKTLRDLAKHKEVVAIGECGLDFNRDFSPRPVQERWFEAQIELACELKLPLFLHERDAHQRFVEILSTYRNQFDAAVVHCFTGNGEELDAYLNLGLHIGITGWICDERRGLHLREVVRDLPLDRLLIETDAPYLLPRDLQPKPRSRRNEPMYLPHVLEAIAAARGQPAREIAAATTQNALRLFNWRDDVDPPR